MNVLKLLINFVLIKLILNLNQDHDDSTNNGIIRRIKKGGGISCQDLLLGQFKCDEPVIDHETQSAVNCTKLDRVQVWCYPNMNIKCNNQTFDGETKGFIKEKHCRYTTTYNYQTTLLLSIFFGFFGFDRFYLGYYAMGTLKLCTGGFLFIGYLIDLVK
jgi:hypothetical protein